MNVRRSGYVVRVASDWLSTEGMGMPSPSHNVPDEESWCVQTWIASDEDATACTFKSIEIRATTGSRDEWEARFWGLFPTGSDDFARLARSPRGIHVTIDLAGRVPMHVKSSYGPYSASKLSRLTQQQRAEIASRSKALAVAVATFERDCQLEDATRKRVLLSTLDRLPRPPAGYYWAPDYGGVHMEGMNVATFRLWSPRLGYMPLSE